MARPFMLGTRNWFAGATLSGGAWSESGDVSLQNLKDIQLGLVARSVDDDPASTVVIVDLGASYPLGIIGVVNHNMTAVATQEVVVAETEGELDSDPVWSSGVEPVWRGTDTPATNTGEAGLPIYMPQALVVPPAPMTGRWLRLSYSDATNPMGRVELGYGMAWETWTPEWGIARGGQLAIETGSIGEPSIGLVEAYDRRPSRRRHRFATRWMQPADASRALRIQRDRDLVLPVFVMPKPDEPATWLERAFLGRSSRPGPLDAPFVDREHTVWDVNEVVA